MKNIISTMLFLSVMLSGCTNLPGIPAYQITGAPQTTPTETPESSSPVPTIDNTPISAPTLVSTIDPSPANKKKVIFWHPWVGKRAAVLNQMVLEYNLSNPQDIIVELVGWGSEMDLLMNISSSTQNQPHLVALSPEYLGEGLIPSIDLSRFITQPPDQLGWDDLQNISGNLLSPVSQTGEVIGLPARLDARVMVYNKTWAKELGFEKKPVTWQDFEELSCAAARQNNKLSDRKFHGTGGWIIDDSPEALLTWLNQYGITLPDTTVNENFQFENVDIEKIFTRVRGIAGSGCAWEARNPNWDIYFQDRYAVFISLPFSQLDELQGSLQAAKSKDEWDVISFPADTAQTTWTPVSEYYAILPAADGQELAAWLLLRWLMAPEQELRLAMSEGTIPANQLSRDAMTKVDLLPEQQRFWLGQIGEPAIIPSLPAWLKRKRVLQDGFNQIIQANTSQDQINVILKNMDSFFEEMETTTP